ncbi:MAG: hypothetical protein HFJ38_04435 [Bacilli bacterium]|nr:hypothetical protein [Bacilli bacterium]
MTEKEQEILKLYLKNVRKKQILGICIVACIIVSGIGLFYVRELMKNDNQNEIAKENFENEIETNNNVVNIIEKKEEKIKENLIEGNLIEGEITKKIEEYENNSDNKNSKVNPVKEENKNIRHKCQ